MKVNPDTAIGDDVIRIAYLTNQYPAVSHTFIRREILALEQLGVHIDRFSVRRPSHRLMDLADKKEEEKTTTLLHHPISMACNIGITMIRSPIQFVKAASSACKSIFVTPAGLKYIAYLFEACRLVQLCKAKELNHVHVHMGTNAAAVAQLSSLLGGPAYSITMHGPDEWSDPDGYQLAYKASDAQFVACISEFAANQFRDIVAPKDHHKVRIIRCGVDQTFLNKRRATQSQSQEFVCIGRLCVAKGQLLLIDAFSEILASHPQARLTLCGDGELRGQVEQRIADHRLENSVSLTGWATQDEVISRLQGARAMVLPSFAEGLPVVIMEAMAIGCPVLSTRIAGIPELIEDDINGWLVESGDLPGLVNAMKKCLDTDKETTEKMNEQASEAIGRLHDVNKNVKQLKDEFAKIKSLSTDKQVQI